MQCPPRHPLHPPVDAAAGGHDDPHEVGEPLGLHGLLQPPGDRALDGGEAAAPQGGHGVTSWSQVQL